ncbi:DUF2339 domain-containing protein [Prosthecobacter vanneervenii]|uniref:Putative membrane protein n=1 Tax=Prosthecobacter vanneervenii TaxID=48466 RepID=A0A7W7YAA1_9BACT|nr:DUF2339 domain-containing protein [Prosthecobacter vanneervenii]MBB5032506.1 putative membrane protein [Prosthecobacter vanneervenii]
MEEIVFILLIVSGAVLVMPIIALVTANLAKRRIAALDTEIQAMREREDRLIRRIEALENTSPSQTTTAAVPPASAPATVAAPPPLEPVFAAPSSVASPAPAVRPPDPQPPATVPAVSPPYSRPPAPPRPRSAPAPGISLEQFMGAKLFAWVGGLALFLGIVFFVKLSIERGWISAELRTAIGFVMGAALVSAGVVIQRRRAYATLAHTLCATGIVVLYGVSFAAHALYHIPPFHHSLVTFGMMALITTAAFLLAVRMEAQVVAVLGMLGGFLTPILCSTGHDNPGGLFGYIALLDIGVLAVARSKRWLHLTALAAAGTIFMQAGWMVKFFHSSHYAMGAATWVPVSVFLGFAVLFALAAWWSRRSEDEDAFPAAAALALCGSALFTAFVFLCFGAITERPTLLYSFVLGINLVVMCLVWLQPRMAKAHAVVVTLTFLHLSEWTVSNLSAALLSQALGIYLVFGLIHSAYAVLWHRRNALVAPFIGWMPVITLLLLLLPVLCLDSVSLLLWPAILLVDLLIIGLAILSGALLPVLVALFLTLLTAAVWLFHLPSHAAGGLGQFLVVVGGFAVLFGGMGSFLARKVPKALYASLLPVSSAVLPFALLIMATLHLGVADPSQVFGLGLLLTLFLLGLVRISGITVLAPTALGCVLALEWAWHGQSFSTERAVTPLLWYAGFYVLFTVFPLVFAKLMAARRLPWIASAASGLGTFGLVYRAVGLTWPNETMGLLPLAFAIAPLLCLVFVLKQHSAENPARLSQLAWFGGVALFFITLIFPVQFEKQWITIGWALEGAALCWLFLRVAHPGLRATGAVLLSAAFVRLALNPAVLQYQVRGGTALLNWELYAYSLCALALFAAARLLAPPHHCWGKINLRSAFCAFGGILLFLLLNIEIADAFTPSGQQSITFDFDGSFARDMTYTIAWALYALALLVIGIWQKNAPTRYAGIGLLAIALLKLFLHDLASIESIYRIGALMVVAVIALAASFLYQRFLTDDRS